MAVLRYRLEQVGLQTTPFTKFIDGCYAELTLTVMSKSAFVDGVSGAFIATEDDGVWKKKWPIIQGPDGKPISYAQEMKFTPNPSDETSITGTLLVVYYDESR